VPSRWLVDGLNVIGSRPDGWWRDRPAAMRKLARRLEEFAETTGDEVTVVFDGRPFDVDAGRVQVMFASRQGPNAADDDIAELVAHDEDPASLKVVTTDSALAGRVREHGAEVVTGGRFERELPS
jgi:predicted RNA-binding protein with PIN domain